ncbi:hypothetical protein K432DRAFT_55196 [Lepidopterella palustris CBS 459.81]|uniref:Uncharacterized protein n=1 Tax=Lepidopterella palustris CBS 459.81 TaxID=1314670 RepID=A0A8E2E9J2_9PEZI|nr:hypothetical protein K432DRAFT_55196 [Lepidopterella palustris CBS 459.81]
MACIPHKVILLALLIDTDHLPRLSSPGLEYIHRAISISLSPHLRWAPIPTYPWTKRFILSVIMALTVTHTYVGQAETFPVG